MKRKLKWTWSIIPTITNKNKQAPQTIQCKKYPRHMCLGQAQIWCGIKPINEISTLPLMIVESPKTIQI